MSQLKIFDVSNEIMRAQKKFILGSTLARVILEQNNSRHHTPHHLQTPLLKLIPRPSSRVSTQPTPLFLFGRTVRIGFFWAIARGNGLTGALLRLSAY